ncbi:hypothetical protein BCR33DRAFT_847636 [Rhizoclosmatium globosum]|uniref:Uncharacterized protein n=1 Tax=Rhizoclosmatium globosum TaxID=329046 RepID=A0A1Y2CRF6_9FUNG|nr:hypothetical protein BCR33DRAFT_847636 [Rhizoclosmatium globosum]|eukprot:ORY48935.1 hypothetical protein BCR33DRAFT_847636 [Rhizoclosmatium globosum]
MLRAERPVRLEPTTGAALRRRKAARGMKQRYAELNAVLAEKGSKRIRYGEASPIEPADVMESEGILHNKPVKPPHLAAAPSATLGLQNYETTLLEMDVAIPIDTRHSNTPNLDQKPDNLKLTASAYRRNRRRKSENRLTSTPNQNSIPLRPSPVPLKTPSSSSTILKTRLTNAWNIQCEKSEIIPFSKMPDIPTSFSDAAYTTVKRMTKYENSHTYPFVRAFDLVRLASNYWHEIGQEMAWLGGCSGITEVRVVNARYAIVLELIADWIEKGLLIEAGFGDKQNPMAYFHNRI